MMSEATTDVEPLKILQVWGFNLYKHDVSYLKNKLQVRPKVTSPRTRCLSVRQVGGSTVLMSVTKLHNFSADLEGCDDRSQTARPIST